jgi:hypothetical protein
MLGTVKAPPPLQFSGARSWSARGSSIRPLLLGFGLWVSVGVDSIAWPCMGVILRLGLPSIRLFLGTSCLVSSPKKNTNTTILVLNFVWSCATVAEHGWDCRFCVAMVAVILKVSLSLCLLQLVAGVDMDTPGALCQLRDHTRNRCCE